eukprot:m.17574 g.17574  ORF g.17574 m.17574 type:complete len:1148 (+) comp11568_c0_seq1:103-3546(+)
MSNPYEALRIESSEEEEDCDANLEDTFWTTVIVPRDIPDRNEQQLYRNSYAPKLAHVQDHVLVPAVIAWNSASVPDKTIAGLSDCCKVIISERAPNHPGMILSFQPSTTTRYLQNGQDDAIPGVGQRIGVFISQVGEGETPIVKAIKVIRLDFRTVACSGETNHGTCKFSMLCDFKHATDGDRWDQLTLEDHANAIGLRIPMLLDFDGGGDLYPPSGQYSCFRYPQWRSNRQQSWTLFRSKINRRKKVSHELLPLEVGIVVCVQSISSGVLGIIVTENLSQYVFEGAQVPDVTDTKVVTLEAGCMVKFSVLRSFSFESVIPMYHFAVDLRLVQGFNRANKNIVLLPSVGHTDIPKQLSGRSISVPELAIEPNAPHRMQSKSSVPNTCPDANSTLDLLRQSLIGSLDESELNSADLKEKVMELCERIDHQQFHERLASLNTDDLSSKIEIWAHRYNVTNTIAVSFARDALKKADVDGSKLINNFHVVDEIMVQEKFSFAMRQAITYARLDLAPGHEDTIKPKLISGKWGARVNNVTGDPKSRLDNLKALTAKVFNGVWEDERGNRVDVAVKEVQTKDIHGTDFNAMVQNEAEALGVIRHKNLVQLFQASRFEIEGAQYCWLVLELCDTTLETAMRAGLADFPGLIRRVQLCIGMLEGLRALHEYNQQPAANGIMHRDIKPLNVLLKKNVKGDWIPKLCDMGFALHMESFDETKSQSKRRIEEVGLGTEGYMDSYLRSIDTIDLLKVRFHSGSDVFSMGCVMYEVLTAAQCHDNGAVHAFLNFKEFMILYGARKSMARMARKHRKILDNMDEDKMFLLPEEIMAAHPNANQHLVNSMITLIGTMLVPVPQNRPTPRHVHHRITVHPAMVTSARRYLIVDEIVKKTATALVPFAAAVADSLLDCIKKMSPVPCGAQWLHESWNAIPPQKDAKILSGTGRETFIGVKVAQRDMVKFRKERTVTAGLSVDELKKFYALQSGEEQDEYLHTFDGKGGACTCVEVAKKLASLHAGNGPLWYQSDRSTWWTDGWELLKLFLPRLGRRARHCPAPNNADLLALFAMNYLYKDAKAVAGLDDADWNSFVQSVQSDGNVAVIRNNSIAHATTQDYDMVDLEADVKAIICFLKQPLFDKFGGCERDATLKRIQELTDIV